MGSSLIEVGCILKAAHSLSLESKISQLLQRLGIEPSTFLAVSIEKVGFYLLIKETWVFHVSNGQNVCQHSLKAQPKRCPTYFFHFPSTRFSFVSSLLCLSFLHRLAFTTGLGNQVGSTTDQL